MAVVAGATKPNSLLANCLEKAPVKMCSIAMLIGVTDRVRSKCRQRREVNNTACKLSRRNRLLHGSLACSLALAHGMYFIVSSPFTVHSSHQAVHGWHADHEREEVVDHRVEAPVAQEPPRQVRHALELVVDVQLRRHQDEAERVHERL